MSIASFAAGLDLAAGGCGGKFAIYDAHHEHLRFAWRMVLGDGSVFVEGIDIGELSADGRLHRIVGFLGPLASGT